MTDSTTPGQPPQSFSWARVLYQLNLRGTRAAIGWNCEPKFYDASRPFLMLELKDTLRGLEESPAMDQFKEGLKSYFGESLQLLMTYGPAVGSPAELATAGRVSEHTKALQAVMNDDMIQGLIKTFDAKIVVDTVEQRKPATQPT